MCNIVLVFVVVLTGTVLVQNQMIPGDSCGKDRNNDVLLKLKELQLEFFSYKEKTNDRLTAVEKLLPDGE